MAKYRIWTEEDPEVLVTGSLAQAIKYIKKNSDLDESNSGLEELIDGDWDEWLDRDDQNVHDHLYMYGSRSEYLRKDEEVDEEDDSLFDDGYVEEGYSDDEDDADFDDDDDEEFEDEDRLLNAIGGSVKNADGSDEEEDFSDDAEDEFGDEEEDDFDEEDEDEEE